MQVHIALPNLKARALLSFDPPLSEREYWAFGVSNPASGLNARHAVKSYCYRAAARSVP